MKMFDSPPLSPTIRRTLRSNALGNNYKNTHIYTIYMCVCMCDTSWVQQIYWLNTHKISICVYAYIMYIYIYTCIRQISNIAYRIPTKIIDSDYEYYMVHTWPLLTPSTGQHHAGCSGITITCNVNPALIKHGLWKMRGVLRYSSNSHYLILFLWYPPN